MEYVFRYSRSRLFAYHVLVMDEMAKRGYRADPAWRNPLYRGKRAPADAPLTIGEDNGIYPEHNDKYLRECIENLKEKGIELES